MNNKYNDICSLDEWVSIHNSNDDKRITFLNMDRALKYIHDRGYCVSEFITYSSPTSISVDVDVLNGNSSYIKFRNTREFSRDPVLMDKEKRNDIFMSSIIQICYYLNIPLYQMNIEFLKSNFDSFAQFLPRDDVPYYRGVIVRGSSVYLCEYETERRNRDLEKFSSDMGGSGKALVKMSPHRIDLEGTNDSINDKIYSKMGNNDDAFISYLLVPTIIVFSLLLLSMIGWIVSLF